MLYGVDKVRSFCTALGAASTTRIRLRSRRATGFGRLGWASISKLPSAGPLDPTLGRFVLLAIEEIALEYAVNNDMLHVVEFDPHSRG